MLQDEGHGVHERLILSGRANIEHLEHAKEGFAVRGVEAPEEGLIAIPMMRTHLFTLLQQCRGPTLAFEDLTHLVAHLGAVLDFCSRVTVPISC